MTNVMLSRFCAASTAAIFLRFHVLSIVIA